MIFQLGIAFGLFGLGFELFDVGAPFIELGFEFLDVKVFMFVRVVEISVFIVIYSNT